MDLSLVVGLAGVVIGVLGVAVAVVLHRRAKRLPRVLWAANGNVVVDPGNEGAIEIRFFGEPVERVVRTQVTIWNAGYGTLRSDDIPRKDPLRVVMSEADVLAVRAEGPTLANEVSCQPPDETGSIPISLAYLDPGQQILVDVTHTGDRRGAHVEGSVIGSGRVSVYKPLKWLPLLMLVVGQSVAFGVLFALGRFADQTEGVLRGVLMVSTGVATLGLVFLTFALVGRYSERVQRLTGASL